jgi:hypothetical protein
MESVHVTQAVDVRMLRRIGVVRELVRRPTPTRRHPVMSRDRLETRLSAADRRRSR